MSLKVISTNEYQDCIRITEGFLLVVNKFYFDEVKDFDKHYKIPKNYYRKLNKGVKDDLWILTRPVKYWYWGIDENGDDANLEGIFPIGTVFYEEKPVYKSDDPDNWSCYIRTAWGINHGCLDYLIGVSECIKKILGRYKETYGKNTQ